MPPKDILFTRLGQKDKEMLHKFFHAPPARNATLVVSPPHSQPDAGNSVDKSARDDLSQPTDNMVENTEGNAMMTKTAVKFSINEFARLIVLIRDDEHVHRAVRKSTAEDLEPAEMTEGVSRSSFWTIVAERFNNPFVPASLDLCGLADEVNASEKPLCHRSAGQLQNAFIKGKTQFTEKERKWAVSGNNTTSPFIKFLEYNQKDGSLKADSKKSLIMFAACKLGTAQPDYKLLELFKKTIDNGDRDVQGYDEGFSSSQSLPRERFATDEEISGREKYRRKRQNTSSELDGQISSSMSVLTNTAEAIGVLANQRIGPSATSNKMNSDITNIMNQDHLLGLLDTAVERLGNAQKKGHEALIKLNERSIAAIERQLERLLEASERDDAGQKT